MRTGRSNLLIRVRNIVLLFVTALVFLVVAPRRADALQNRPREAADMQGIRDDDLTDYHDHYHDHSHDEHNFDEEGHKHVHWEL